MTEGAAGDQRPERCAARCPGVDDASLIKAARWVADLLSRADAVPVIDLKPEAAREHEAASNQGTEFLQAILAKLRGLPLEEQLKIIAQAEADPRLWIPNPGPQTDALNSLAGEIFFGGVLGGGKTALIVGAALTQHERSIISGGSTRRSAASSTRSPAS